MISNRCYYALKAILELAKRDGAGLITIAEIAKAQHIPARFLEAILIQLKKRGIARSVRGKQGGYALARPPRTVTVGEVVSLFEGPICSLDPSATGSKKSQDVFADIWDRTDAALAAILNKVHFAELAEKDRARAAHGHANYVI